MDIIICEDNVEQLNFVKTVIENYAMMEDDGMKVVLATTNPDDVVSYIQVKRADCYFLDIDLEHDLTGITLGSKIREVDTMGNIIYITTHAEMSYLTFIYKIAAMDFIIKDDQEVMKVRLISTLKEAHRRYLMIGSGGETNTFQIKTAGRLRNINIDDVYFFEASTTLHKIVLHLENEWLEFYGKLKDYEAISDKFYRCHKAYIVNTNKIHSIDYKTRTVYMGNGEEIFASARQIRGLKEFDISTV